ncbi:MAG TPA: hypothetical protein VNZ45_10330, partial [Bacteroidia bacterium]|nr:hypothetical protein [Bacteroidia bacterium]
GIAAQYSPQEWAALKQQYTDKLASSGRPTSHLSDKDIALETYAEQGVDYLKSGKGFVDAKSAFNPAISANPSALKNVMAKLGYSFDEHGNTVKGTNLFQGNSFNNKFDALQKSYMTEKQKYDLDYKEDRVDRIITPEDLKNTKVLDKLKAVPEIARDAKGNVMKDKDGNILRISTSAVDKQYRMLGEDIKKQVNHLPQDMRDAIGHTIEGNGTEHFNYLPDQVIQNLKDSNKYNPEQLENLAKINRLRQDTSLHGNEVKVFYQAATSKGRYGSIAGADRFWTPQGFTVTTKGNLNIKMADYSKMVNNYLKMQNKPDVRAAGFTSPADFQNHASQYFENHQQGLPGYTGLDNNPKIALAKRDAINATLGLDTTTWRGNNPLAAQLPNRSGSFIIDGRLDRMNNVTPTDTIRPPVNYGLVNKNYLPNQSATK